MELLDSRRLTGPNLIWNQYGAVIDVKYDRGQADVVDLWAMHARNLLDALGWNQERTCIRRYPQGASLSISAPLDVLYAACEINEWCWNSAVESLQSRTVPDYASAAAGFRDVIAEEANPGVLQMQRFATRHKLPFLRDDDHVSLGFGRYSQTWPVDKLPDTGKLDPGQYKPVPVGLVTGTNGKTTSVRLAAHIARTAGNKVGFSSTDWIAINDEIIDRGDYSGPGGARTVLRDRRADTVILETARGGLLRRGLGVNQANAALITNIAEDHMGEFGVQTLEELADVKWIVSSVLGAGDVLVLLADDPLLVRRGRESRHNIAWFSDNPAHPLLQENIAGKGWAATVEKEQVVLYARGERHELGSVADIPVTLGGAARHNVLNVLGVVALTHALGVPVDRIAQGLQTFEDQDNPGRCNQFLINGARVIVDFAHNPHGMKAFISVAKHLDAGRKILVTGQAGDRSDADIRELAHESANEVDFDRIIVKTMDSYARGRRPGETAEIMRDEYLRCGMDAGRIDLVEKELDAVNQAVQWCQPGDLALLLIHENRREVLDHLARLQQA